MNVSPLLAVRDLERSVDFYRLIGFEPIVITETYAKLTMNDGALHLAAEGDAPPDRSEVPLRAAGADGSSVSAIVVIEVDDCEEFCRAIVGRGPNCLARRVSQRGVARCAHLPTTPTSICWSSTNRPVPRILIDATASHLTRRLGRCAPRIRPLSAHSPGREISSSTRAGRSVRTRTTSSPSATSKVQ
jgi:hypothetical protein